MKKFLFPVLVALAMVSGASAAPVSVTSARPFDLGDYRVNSMSPDGSLIAAHDKDSLCTFDTTTFEEVACADLSVLDSGLREEDIVWSPDSSKIAFSENAFRIFRDGDIWVMDAQTGELTDLTDEGVRGKLPILSSDDTDITEFFIDVNPAWSPDSETVAFSRTIWRNGEWRGNAISTIPAVGGEVNNLLMVNLTLPGAVYFGVLWQGDGEKIYFNYADVDPEEPENGIWVIDADGRNPRQLAGGKEDSGGAAALRVSPDGRSILLYYPLQAAQNGFSSDVFAVLDTESGEMTALNPPVDATAPQATLGLVTMSPDGSTLLLVVTTDFPEQQVFAYDLTTREYTALQTDFEGAISPAIGVMPTWAENGTAMLNVDLVSGTVLEISGP